MPAPLPNESPVRFPNIRECVHEIHNANNLAMLNTSLMTRIWNDLGPLLEALGKTSPDLKLGNLPLGMVLEEVPLILSGQEEASERIRLAGQEIRRLHLLERPES
jgi:hypothetical protein